LSRFGQLRRHRRGSLRDERGTGFARGVEHRDTDGRGGRGAICWFACEGVLRTNKYEEKQQVNEIHVRLVTLSALEPRFI
jgi:hypothetical protein